MPGELFVQQEMWLLSLKLLKGELPACLQLRSNPPIAVSPTVAAWQPLQIDRHRCAFTGCKGLSQFYGLCSYLHSKFPAAQNLTENQLQSCLQAPASIGWRIYHKPPMSFHYDKLKGPPAGKIPWFIFHTRIQFVCAPSADRLNLGSSGIWLRIC